MALLSRWLLVLSGLALGACRFDVDRLSAEEDAGADGPVPPGADGSNGGSDGSPADARLPQDGETELVIREESLVADVHLDEFNPDTNFGADVTLMVRGQNPRLQTLIRFDLAGLAPATEIVQAKMDLWVGSETSETLSIWPVTMPWVEDEATHTRASAGAAWPLAGDVPIDEATQYYLDAPIDDVPVSVDLTVLVGEWHSGLRANHGVLLWLDSTQQANFAASENSSYEGPTLTVRYR